MWALFPNSYLCASRARSALELSRRSRCVTEALPRAPFAAVICADPDGMQKATARIPSSQTEPSTHISRLTLSSVPLAGSPAKPLLQSATCWQWLPMPPMLVRYLKSSGRSDASETAPKGSPAINLVGASGSSSRVAQLALARLVFLAASHYRACCYH